MGNWTTVREFTLEGFPAVQHLGRLLFFLHLLAYLTSIMGNIVIISIVCTSAYLKTPMYYLISIFSFTECCFTSTVIPKLLAIFLLGKQSISFVACFIQSYFFVFIGSFGFLFIAVMSVDRGVAICKPLHYPSIMNLRTCTLLVMACLSVSITVTSWGIVTVSQLSFCGPNVIPHFFCDPLPLIHISCSDTRYAEAVGLTAALIVLLLSLMVAIISYSSIAVTIVHLPSAKERKKAFSTCSSHLIVLSLMYGSSVFIYIKPNKTGRLDSNREVALINTVVTPLLNPIIYTLRNKQVHQALRETVRRVKISR